MKINDSGDRREFATGAVRDMAEGKGRMDLLPWSAIMEISKQCENGSKKYGEHNVDKGIPTHSFCDSAARHLAKYLEGWDDEPHLLAAAWNLLWAIQMEIKHPEMVDTPWQRKSDEDQKENKLGKKFIEATRRVCDVDLYSYTNGEKTPDGKFYVGQTVYVTSAKDKPEEFTTNSWYMEEGKIYFPIWENIAYAADDCFVSYDEACDELRRRIKRAVDFNK